MKWYIKEYASEQAYEWYFEDDYKNYLVYGNKDYSEIGNEDIKSLFTDLDCLCCDVGDLFEEKDDGEDVKEIDFINAINYYLDFKTEALKEFNKPCNVDNLNDYINVLNTYMEEQDEDVIASLLTLITGTKYAVHSISGCAQMDWQEVIAPINADIDGIQACYFGTCAEVYCKDTGTYEIVPVSFCTEDEAKDYIIKYFDSDAEVYKEASYQVTQYNYTMV